MFAFLLPAFVLVLGFVDLPSFGGLKASRSLLPMLSAFSRARRPAALRAHQLIL